MYFKDTSTKMNTDEFRYHQYNHETEEAIQEAKDIMAGKIQTKTYSSAKELFSELDK